MRQSLSLLCLFGTCCSIAAQSLMKDSVLLSEAVVENRRSHLSGSKIIMLDSNTTGNNLAQYLQNNSPFYLKQYGAHQLSTLSLRGGSSNHTQFIWNGFNVNNVMLGQKDLSIVPSQALNQSSIILGNQSAYYGSGAIGGTIILDEGALKKNLKTCISFNQSLGSYESYTSSLNFAFAYKKIANENSIYWHQSKNDFVYLDYIKGNQIKRISNNENRYMGLNNKFQYHINSKNVYHINVWWYQQERQIPPTIIESVSTASQLDHSLKIQHSWTHFFNQQKLKISSAFFKDRLLYQNGFISDAKTLSWLTMAEYEWNLSNHWNLALKSQYNKTDVQFDNYENPIRSISQFNTTLSINKNLNDKGLINWQSRIERQFGKWSPYISQFGIDYQILQWLKGRANAGNAYRWPSLNDLFWKGSGNPNLKPEHGYTSEIGFDAIYKKNNYTFQHNATVYYKAIKNWIIWIPASGIWQPENIGFVKSRGLEMEISWQQKINDFKLNLGLQYLFNLATNEIKKFEGDATYKKQLIYTPIEQIFGKVELQYKNTGILIASKRNGYRYTLADNSAYLNAFWMSNIVLSHSFKFKVHQLALRLCVNNLENKNIEYIAYSPMMKRNYQLTINYQIQNK